MLNSLEIDGRRYEFDASAPIDISIPLQFNGPQPNAYSVEPATSTPCAAGELVGDTRQGGSCNFEQYTFIPHCNGTHTECVGHITHERIGVRDCLRDAFVIARLISVEPKHTGSSMESYSGSEEAGDLAITREELQRALGDSQSETHDSLIVRTIPNSESKQTRRYIEDVPPYFTTQAMELMVELRIRHLLVDLPSVDRLYDNGRLSNHRIFWKVDQGSFDLSEIARRDSTITELIYVPNDIADGRYLLNLQIAPFASDASPSRPLLFRLLQN